MNKSNHNAIFTDENDHNPIVDETCPRCHGEGRYWHCVPSGEGVACDKPTCEVCNGTGVIGESVAYFSNQQPEIEAVAHENRWITCPNCNIRFKLTNKYSWTGKRHMTCGQKIKVVN